MSEQRTEQQSVAERLLAMRDDLVALINVYNSAGEYVKAHELQVFVIGLTSFEDGHYITNEAWPPRVDPDGGLLWIEKSR